MYELEPLLPSNELAALAKEEKHEYTQNPRTI
jgi:hypothetical protein